jgi:hypothetical protein
MFIFLFTTLLTLVFTMSTVIGVRVPREVKEELDRLGIDYSEEVRRLFEEVIRRRRMEEAVESLRRFRSSIGEVEGDHAVEIFREERDRH